MPSLGSIWAYLGLDINNLQKGAIKGISVLSGVDQKMQALELRSLKTGKKLQSVGNSMSSFGKKMTLGVTLPLVALASKMTLTAARTEVLGVAMEAVGKATGTSIEELKKQEKILKKQGITTQEARGILTLFMQSQLDVADASKVARVAQDLAVISGQNSSEAARTLTDAITSQEPMLLRQYGIVKSAPKIFDEYGKSIGKTAEQLSETEKKQAFLNIILEEGGKVAGTYETAMGKVGKKLTSLPRYFEEAANSLGEQFLPAFNRGVDVLTDWLKAVNKMTPVQKKFIVYVLGTVAALGPLLVITGILTSKIGSLYIGVSKIAGLFVKFSAAAKVAGGAGILLKGTLVSIASTAAIVVAVVAAVAAVGYLIYKNWSKITGLFKELGTVWQTFIGMLQEGWSTGDSVMGALEQSFGRAGGAFELLGNIMDDVISTMKPIMEDARKFFLEIWEKIVAWYQENLPLIQETTETVMGAVQSVIETVMPVIQAIWNAVWPPISETIKAVWEIIKTVVTTALDVILNALELVMNLINGNWGDAWDNVKNIVMAVLSGIVSIVGTIGGLLIKAVIAIWGAIKEATVAAWDAVIAYLSGVWETITTFFSNLWQGAVDWTVQAWETIKTTVSDGITAIVTFFSELPGKVITFLTDFFVNRLPVMIGAGMGHMSRIVKAATLAVVTFFLELPGKIHDVLIAIATFILEKWKQAKDWTIENVTAMYQAVVSNVTAIYNAVVEWFSQMPGRVKEYVTNVANTIRDKWQQAKDWTIEKVTAIYNAVVDWLSKLPGKVAEFLASIPDKFKSAFETAKTESKSKLQELLDWIKTLPGKVATAFGNIGRRAYEALTAWFGKIKKGFTDALNPEEGESPSPLDYLAVGLSRAQAQYSAFIKDIEGMKRPAATMIEPAIAGTTNNNIMNRVEISGDIVLPNVTNAKDFVDELRNITEHADLLKGVGYSG